MGENGPAAIAFDALIVMPGIVIAARLSHDVPAGAAGVVAWPNSGSIAATTKAAANRRVMKRLLGWRDYTVSTTFPIT